MIYSLSSGNNFLDNSCFEFIYHLYPMPYIFAIKLGFIGGNHNVTQITTYTRNKTLSIDHFDCLRKNISSVRFCPDRGLFHLYFWYWRSFYYELRSYFMVVCYGLKFCVIRTLLFIFFQHKRRQNNYVERNQGCQAHG